MSTEASALPIYSLIKSSPSTALATTPGATGANQVLGQNDFLTLLTTQLANQDPLNPMDDTQSVSQLAEVSALQATTNLANSFGTFTSNSAISQASNLLGDAVTVTTADAGGASSTVTGMVKSVQIVNGTPQFTMVDANGNPIAGSDGAPLQFTTSQIVGISK